MPLRASSPRAQEPSFGRRPLLSGATVVRPDVHQTGPKYAKSRDVDATRNVAIGPYYVEMTVTDFEQSNSLLINRLTCTPREFPGSAC